MRESYVIRDSHSTYKTVNYHYKSICYCKYNFLIEVDLSTREAEALSFEEEEGNKIMIFKGV
ncbi:hypothetical protein GGR08_001653 [Bartonella fuyuanensis]|uniref:Uncharacterized protein n=1 Tax=Bartonella fuyuanensis TaxID=1460968 RepID=A0A840E0N4_9HYPH|nr:hypothetical protein [Bartonella fuyuanensis]